MFPWELILPSSVKQDNFYVFFQAFFHFTSEIEHATVFTDDSKNKQKYDGFNLEISWALHRTCLCYYVCNTR